MRDRAAENFEPIDLGREIPDRREFSFAHDDGYRIDDALIKPSRRGTLLRVTPKRAVENGRVAKVFSRETLQKFEDASASIPLRQLTRAFANAGLRMGEDPGGAVGSRRTDFRRYVAGVDQHDPKHIALLGVALGALIAEVATSKIDFLVNAAQSDGFVFAEGAFSPVESGASTRSHPEDMKSIDRRGTELRVLAEAHPEDALNGAKELVDSVCRSILLSLDAPAPRKTAGLADITKQTLEALGVVSSAKHDTDDALARKCLRELRTLIVTLDEMQSAKGSARGPAGKRKTLSARHARLAAGVALTFASFVAETYVERKSERS